MITKELATSLQGKVIMVSDNGGVRIMKVDEVTPDCIKSEWSYAKTFHNGEMKFTRNYKHETPLLEGGFIDCEIKSEGDLQVIADLYCEYIGIRDVLANKLSLSFFNIH